jgi:uncharacterized protein YaiI (UPF0178 family)
MTNGSHDPQVRLRKMLDLNPSPRAITIYVDADACPVKQEVYRVAERHALKGVDLKVLVVSNSPIAVPRDIFVGGRPDAKPGSTFAGRPLVERVVVGAGMDEADNWIAERATHGDIVVTADVPLASRCVKAGAEVIGPNGKPFAQDSMGMTLATRNLMDSLRSAGEITGGPKPFAPRDHSAFLSALDQAIVRLRREGFGQVAG